MVGAITMATLWCVSAAGGYRSIIGDSAMRWGRPPMPDEQAATTVTPQPQYFGPRMELFFYGLCSKAGFSNLSVVPAGTDTCDTKPPGQRIGIGTVATVAAADCCSACLAMPWCLAWTEVAQGTCALKDNAMPMRPPPPTPPPTPIPPASYRPHPGVCGGTVRMPPAACNSSTSGSVAAREHGITTLRQCEAFCARCGLCQYVSFSIGSHAGEDHDDCSWYSDCDLEHLLHVGANYTSLAVHKSPAPPGPPPPPPELVSGVRVYHPNQELPAPRYANCVVDGKQTVSAADNAATAGLGVDDEYFAVLKEQMLAARCSVPAPTSAATAATPSYFWTVMSQNGNAPSSLGTDAECLPYCYLTPGHRESPTPVLYNGSAGYPPAVNASDARCVRNAAGDRTLDGTLAPGGLGPGPLRSGFDGQPENQGKVMVEYTDPADPGLAGGFNWTFELDADLAVPEAEFPIDKSLGVFSWRYDEARGSGVVRMYQRVSPMFAWICTYFGADVAEGVKANQAYDGRGMMTEHPIIGTDFKTRFWLNISKNQIHGGSGVGSWYFLNMEACWDQLTGKNCRPYGDTNAIVHQQVLLDLGGSDGCTGPTSGGCPPFHIEATGEKIPRSDVKRFPYSAYKYYCCPCTSCVDCVTMGLSCCDPLSNPNGQSIYKLAPDPVWGQYGFPNDPHDTLVGDNGTMYELEVGLLWKHIWFPCMATEPIEIVTLNIGPETGLGSGTHDTEFFISEFDVLVPE